MGWQGLDVVATITRSLLSLIIHAAKSQVFIKVAGTVVFE
jgi:hypothetical protein